MTHYWGHSNDIFDSGYKAFRKGILLFGGFLTILGILIFLFPKLIAFIFASFILFAGISVLMVAYRIWKLQKQVRPFEWEETDLDTVVHRDPSRQYGKTITFIVR